LNEQHHTVISGQFGEYSAPENFCRAIFLQFAIRIKRRRAGNAGRQLARFFANRAEGAFEGDGHFDLYAAPPEGADFADEQHRQLVLSAMQEIVQSIEDSAVQAESWNACPRWREWGIVKAREMLAFLEREAKTPSLHEDGAQLQD